MSEYEEAFELAKKKKKLLVVIDSCIEVKQFSYNVEEYDERKHKTLGLLVNVIRKINGGVYEAIFGFNCGDLSVGAIFISQYPALNGKGVSAFDEFFDKVNSLIKEAVEKFKLVKYIISLDPKNEFNFPDDKMVFKEWIPDEKKLIKTFCIFFEQEEKKQVRNLIDPNVYDDFNIIYLELLNENFIKIESIMHETGTIVDLDTAQKKATLKTRSEKICFKWCQDEFKDIEMFNYYNSKALVVVKLSIFRKIYGISSDKDKYQLLSLESKDQFDVFN